jgi:hypothetical protein
VGERHQQVQIDLRIEVLLLASTCPHPTNKTGAGRGNSSMRLRIASGFFVVGLFLAPAVARARDYCVSFPTVPSYVLVGRGFTIPKKGQCKLWIGFSPQSDVNQPSTGTGCTSSDGSHLNLSITTGFPEGAPFVEFDSISSLPEQSGTTHLVLLTMAPQVRIHSP